MKITTKSRGFVVIDLKKPIAELPDLLERVFPKGRKRRELAERILRIIRRDGSLKAEKWRDYIKELNTDRIEFYRVLRALKRVGLIYKTGGHNTGEWRFSRQFATELRDMASFWERWAFGNK